MRWGKGKSPPIHHSDSMDLHSLLFAIFCYAFALYALALYGFEFYICICLCFGICIAIHLNCLWIDDDCEYSLYI